MIPEDRRQYREDWILLRFEDWRKYDGLVPDLMVFEDPETRDRPSLVLVRWGNRPKAWDAIGR